MSNEHGSSEEIAAEAERKIRDGTLRDAKDVAGAIIMLCVINWGKGTLQDVSDKLASALQEWENEIRRDEQAKWALDAVKL